MRSVSVVIPARNDGRALRHAIATIEAQAGVDIADIVIAVGPSSDDTESEAHRLARQNPAVRVVTNPSGRTPAALNAAIRSASGDVIVRVDARSKLPEDYMRNALETLIETGAGNVGSIQLPVGSTPTERGIAAAMRHRLGTGGAHYRHGNERIEVETAYLGVFRREALEAVGGYDESFIRNQDSELNIRLRAAGYPVWLDPRLVVAYQPRPTLKTFAQQYWQYGWWRAITLGRHPRSIKARQAVVPLAVVLLSGSTVLGVAVHAGFLAVPAVYGASLVGAAAIDHRASTLYEKAAMSAALVTMHLTWGSGLLISAGVQLGRVLRSHAVRLSS